MRRPTKNSFSGFTRTPTLYLTSTTKLAVQEKTHQSVHQNKKSMLVYGFTLIELLVAIAIIGILASIVLASVNSARDKAKIAKAKAQLRNIRTGIDLLVDDTGKWPDGCPVDTTANPESYLDGAQIGLASPPSVGDQGSGCIWTAADIAKWKGPYIQTPLDPWGRAYDLDRDYLPYDNNGAGGCAQPAEGTTAVIVSYGSDGLERNKYYCDDIFIKIE